jgi:hypothetical protein
MVCVTLALLILTAHQGLSQSSALSLPAAVATDADGKVVGQIAGVEYYPFEESSVPLVFLNIDGKFTVFRLYPWGLEGGYDTVHFDSPNCSGTPYLRGSGRYKDMWGFSQKLGVVGPDPVAGTYRVYYQASPPVSDVTIYSEWGLGGCFDWGHGMPYDFLGLAEEVIPNPLEGFHGPTLAEPDRVWTLEGGDVISPPP